MARKRKNKSKGGGKDKSGDKDAPLSLQTEDERWEFPPSSDTRTTTNLAAALATPPPRTSGSSNPNESMDSVESASETASPELTQQVQEFRNLLEGQGEELSGTTPLNLTREEDDDLESEIVQLAHSEDLLRQELELLQEGTFFLESDDELPVDGRDEELDTFPLMQSFTRTPSPTRRKPPPVSSPSSPGEGEVTAVTSPGKVPGVVARLSFDSEERDTLPISQSAKTTGMRRTKVSSPSPGSDDEEEGTSPLRSPARKSRRRRPRIASPSSDEIPEVASMPHSDEEEDTFPLMHSYEKTPSPSRRQAKTPSPSPGKAPAAIPVAGTDEGREDTLPYLPAYSKTPSPSRRQTVVSGPSPGKKVPVSPIPGSAGSLEPIPKASSKARRDITIASAASDPFQDIAQREREDDKQVWTEVFRRTPPSPSSLQQGPSKRLRPTSATSRQKAGKTPPIPLSPSVPLATVGAAAAPPVAAAAAIAAAPDTSNAALDQKMKPSWKGVLRRLSPIKSKPDSFQALTEATPSDDSEEALLAGRLSPSDLPTPPSQVRRLRSTSLGEMNLTPQTPPKPVRSQSQPSLTRMGLNIWLAGQPEAGQSMSGPRRVSGPVTETRHFQQQNVPERQAGADLDLALGTFASTLSPTSPRRVSGQPAEMGGPTDQQARAEMNVAPVATSTEGLGLTSPRRVSDQQANVAQSQRPQDSSYRQAGTELSIALAAASAGAFGLTSSRRGSDQRMDIAQSKRRPQAVPDRQAGAELNLALGAGDIGAIESTSPRRVSDPQADMAQSHMVPQAITGQRGGAGGERTEVLSSTGARRVSDQAPETTFVGETEFEVRIPLVGVALDRAESSRQELDHVLGEQEQVATTELDQFLPAQDLQSGAELDFALGGGSGQSPEGILASQEQHAAAELDHLLTPVPLVRTAGMGHGQPLRLQQQDTLGGGVGGISPSDFLQQDEGVTDGALIMGQTVETRRLGVFPGADDYVDTITADYSNVSSTMSFSIDSADDGVLPLMYAFEDPQDGEPHQDSTSAEPVLVTTPPRMGIAGRDEPVSPLSEPDSPTTQETGGQTAVVAASRPAGTIMSVSSIGSRSASGSVEERVKRMRLGMLCFCCLVVILVVVVPISVVVSQRNGDVQPMQPSSVPSFAPSISALPSTQPSGFPSFAPSGSALPTTQPSVVPSFTPSSSVSPTTQPSVVHSFAPSSSVAPTLSPVETPGPGALSAFPSETPTAPPTTLPPSPMFTGLPTPAPAETTGIPTALPTQAPVVTTAPSVQPVGVPTSSPSESPDVSMPTSAPTFLRTVSPTPLPSVSPLTQIPTAVSSSFPTALRTPVPTLPPTSIPSPSPVAVSTTIPTSLPSVAPVPDPTMFPTAPLTTAPTLSVEAALFEFLVSISFDGGQALMDPNSPQFAAFVWLSNNAEVTVYPEERIIQRYSLATFFYSTQGDTWTENNLWLSDDDECFWYSRANSACGIEGDFQRLELYFNDVSGTIPEELGLLSNSLESIDIGGGPRLAMGGTLPPELGFLTLLKDLRLQDNSIVGVLPPAYGALVDLEQIELRSNGLRGTLPPEIGNWTSLQTLDFGNNLLRGTLPPTIGRLSTVTRLFLGNNLIRGGVPPEVGQLGLLRSLDLGNNLLAGIPRELGLLSGLEFLLLGNNQLVGTLSTELGQLTLLKSLSVANNTLRGFIPTEFGSLVMLREGLDLSSNQLSGSIPTQLGLINGRLRGLFLQDNLLTGTVPSEFDKFDKVNQLQLQTNDLTGAMPESVCDLFNITLPSVYIDCEEVDCPCCTFCCVDGEGCECRYLGTEQEFLCF